MILRLIQMNHKTKILLDCDVIIHFIKGGYFSLLSSIYKGYDYVILDCLLSKELKPGSEFRRILDNHIEHLATIEIIKWDPSFELAKEFAELKKRYGYGESASMAYCKFNNDIIASSNITEITKYCDDNSITYITTLDFLYKAYKDKMLTENQCNEFIQDVIRKDSILPNIKITQYIPRKLLL